MAQATWTGGGTGWNDPASWSSNPSLPSFGETLIIDGTIATVDAASSFTPGQINIINGGELIINNTLDVSSDTYTNISGSGSSLTVNAGGMFTAEFITVTSGGEILLTEGELDVADKMQVTDGIITISGGLLDSNGIESQGEEMEITNSTFNMTGGVLQFNSSIIVTGGTFTTGTGTTLEGTNANRNLEFHSATADLGGTIDNNDASDGIPNGDLRLFGTSTVNLLASLTIDLDDLVMADDGQNSTLNIHGNVIALDDLKFDDDSGDGDIPGDVDRIIIKDGGSLNVNDRLRDADQLNAGSGIHVEDGGTLNITLVSTMTAQEAYGTVVTSDDGASVTLEGETGLPVELIIFEGTNTVNKIDLKWSTAVEINNDYFEILKSLDGENFKSIAKVNGHGTVNDVKHYSFSDYSVSSGIYYYQLKQVDFNGESELHHIIMVPFNGGENRTVRIHPNPVTTDQVTIQSNIKLTNPVLIIRSIGGKIISKILLDSNTEWTISKSELTCLKGTYLFELVDSISGIRLNSIKISILD